MLEVEDAGAARTRLRERRQEAIASEKSMVSFIKQKEQEPPLIYATLSYGLYSKWWGMYVSIISVWTGLNMFFFKNFILLLASRFM